MALGVWASHLYDPVPFVDAGLDRRAARSDILDQLNPLPTDGEAEAELVLLHDHASLDQTGTWGGEGRHWNRLAPSSKASETDAPPGTPLITRALRWEVGRRVLLLGARRSAL